ncbi:MAG: hypothetical protein ACYCOU_00610 [Sulfobacillus sp.]
MGENAKELRPQDSEDLQLIVASGIRFVIVYPKKKEMLKKEVLARFKKAFSSLNELVDLSGQTTEVYGAFPSMRRFGVPSLETLLKEITDCLGELHDEGALASVLEQNMATNDKSHQRVS